MKVYRPEGTYLAWVDFSGTDIPGKDLQEYLLQECHVAVNAGDFFGKEGEGFVRFNMAGPRDRITPVFDGVRCGDDDMSEVTGYYMIQVMEDMINDDNTGIRQRVHGKFRF